ncbi:MAG: glycosyltransferase [Ectothiorhodospiraceae bacterium]|nr:glycosyltransferase [Ectothiorhodospiraceae bacterium]
MAILAPFKAWGGIERKILILCREFLAQGVRPRLILTRGGVTPYPEELPPDVDVVDLSSGGKADSMIKLIRFLKADPPTALLTAKDHAVKVAVLSRALGRLQVPVYAKVTNTLSYTLRRRLKRGTAKLLYPCADRLIAVSEGVRDDLVRNFGIAPDRVQVIYNPTVTPCIPERAARGVDHPWLQGDGPPVIMGAGRLTAQKDFSTLIAAFARLRARFPARLIILGDGPLREPLQREAEQAGVGEDVSFPGYVADPMPYLARAALFALSSRYEGLANVVIEALAVGTPVVSTNCPSGPEEILMRGELGPLVPVGDEEALADAMLSTLQRPPAPELLRKGLDRFQSGKVATQYLQLMGLGQ